MYTITTPAREFLNPYAVELNKSSLAGEYLDWKGSYTKCASKSYRIWIERFQDHVNKAPEYLTLADVTQFLQSITGKYSEKTVWYGMTIIRNYLRFFKEQGRLPLPLTLVRVPKACSKSHYAITEDEYRTIIADLEVKRPAALRDRLIIRLLHDTGMRVGELSALAIDDIHEDKSATIRTEKTTKFRRVFWNPDTERDLQNYLCERLKHPTESDALFLRQSRNGAGNRLQSRSIERIVKEAAASAGITAKISPHSFRHGFAHRLARLKVPDAIIAGLLGHSTSHTISQYTKLVGVEYEEAFRQAFTTA